MSGRVYEGEVARWFDRGNANGYGFLEYEAGSRTDRVYFDASEIVPDNIGRTSHCKIQGALVRFKLGKHIHRGEPTAKATKVRAVFCSDILNPEDHREVATVDHIVRGTREAIAAAFLLQTSGDKLYLALDGVAETHRDLFQHLEVGRHVWCGIAPPSGNQKSFRAVHSEFYSEDEEATFKQGQPC